MQILLTTIAPALLSGFFGAFVAVYFTNRHQREQWVNDRKREEYRELLVNLSDLVGVSEKQSLKTNEVQETVHALIRSIQSCIFTGPTLDRIKVIDRFNEALGVKERNQSHSLMEKLFSDIHKAAREDIGLQP